jgi:hypothetical protein
MKTVAIIFWSLLLGLFWATTSFADTGSSGGALDHFTQRSVHARLQVAPPDQSVLSTCDAKADCGDHVEHSCETCLYLKGGSVANDNRGGQFFEVGHTVLAASGYARDILDPPRI